MHYSILMLAVVDTDSATATQSLEKKMEKEEGEQNFFFFFIVELLLHRISESGCMFVCH